LLEVAEHGGAEEGVGAGLVAFALLAAGKLRRGRRVARREKERGLKSLCDNLKSNSSAALRALG
jgi:hypothetical protein